MSDESLDWENNHSMEIGRSKEEILPELIDKNFPDIIKKKTTFLFNSYYSGSTHRGGKRLSLVLGCLNQAYKECGQVKDIRDIANILGINKKLVGSAIKNMRIKQSETGSLQHATRYLTALDIVMDIFDRSSYMVDKDYIKALYERVTRGSKKLHRSKPQSVAYALASYYIHHVQKDTSFDLSKLFETPCEMTVKNLVEEIITIESFQYQ